MTSSNLSVDRPSPRGERRIIYVSDPSSIARNHLPDPTTEDDLRRWVDEMADAGANTFIQEAYTQGWTTYWRTEKFEYDARPQHRRFLPLLEGGVQPLEVLLDQSRRRGMEFMAGMRVNDNHGHISVEQGVGAGATFLTDNPQWQVKDTVGSLDRKMSTHLDFTFQEVRDYVASVAEYMLATFDLDGIELCFRDRAYFPEGTERERQPLMTEFVRAVRRIVQRAGEAKGKKLVLGARVYPTLDLCHNQGLDVETWVNDGLIDYVSPGDLMYTSINEPLDEFGELTRNTECMLYPGMLPHSSARRIRFLEGQLISLDQMRAAAQNFYAAGADGVSFYNHMVPIDWAPFYPMALFEMDELGDPEKVARGARHYLFEPMLAGQGIWENGLAPNGRAVPERITLSRSEKGASGTFRFRMCEDVSKVRRASLLFRAYNMTLGDEVEVRLNGAEVTAPALRFRDNEKRIDQRAGVDKSTHKTAGLSPIPAIPDSFVTGWFQLTSPPAVFGDNHLEVTLKSSDPAASEDIVIEEVEVHVAP